MDAPQTGTELDEWPERFEKKDWDWFHGIYIRDDLNDPKVKAELRKILSKIRATVGKIKDENGVQVVERFRSSREVPNELKALAQILELGEFEALVEGPPETEKSQWEALREEVVPVLEGLLKEDEVTEGAVPLSRREHARNALKYIEGIERDRKMLCNQAEGEIEKEWVNEAICSAALAGFQAGRCETYSHHKAIEPDAVRGTKVIGGSRNSAHSTNERYVEPRKKILERLEELIPGHLEKKPERGAVKAAIYTCVDEDLGSFEGIRSIRDRTLRAKKKNCGN